MTQKSVKSNTDMEKEGKSKRVNVTFDKQIWEIIKNTEGLGDGDSSKVQNICVAWLGEQGILSGIIKKRLRIK